MCEELGPQKYRLVLELALLVLVSMQNMHKAGEWAIAKLHASEKDLV